MFKVLKILLLALLLSIIHYPLSIRSAHAQDEFETSYQINYQVNIDTSVSVEQKVILKNKLANVYASQYQVTLGTTRIKDIWAKDSSGPLKPQVEKKSNSVNIKLNFKEKVVGKGKSLIFTLGYTSQDYANKSGRVLEIGIPKIADSQKLKDYQVFLNIPNAFENPAFIMPKPSKITQTASGKKYIFNKDVLKDNSITAAFANFQIFKFELNYHLQNKNKDKVLFKIALPPDTPFQKVFYQQIKPEPDNITLDKEGNWLAKYQLQHGQKLDIVALGSAKIFIQPQNFALKTKINPEDYLSATEYWQADNPEIKKISRQLKNPKAIYDYVVNNLLYDYGRVETNPERMGAVKALKNKSSVVCMEFTDLFIALARSAGIPAREVNGYAYTNNPELKPLSLKQDILHSWPQYYDQEKKLWLSVDPTWGNTTGGIDYFHKLDLNHFAFVFHGEDSVYPLSPGAYKEPADKSRDVIISFGQETAPKPNLALKVNLPTKIIAGLPIQGNIIIKNTGNVALYQTTVKYDLKDYGLKSKSFTINALPPYSFYQKTISLPKTSIFLNGQKNINFYLNSKKISFSIEIKSLFPKKIAFILNKLINWFSLFFKKIIKIKL